MANSQAPVSDLSRLRAGSTILLVLAVIQLVLGGLVLSKVGGETMVKAHSGIAYLLLITSAVAAFFAYRYGKENNQMGRFGHAVSIPVMCVLQIIFIEAGWRQVHIIFGVLTIVAIISLYVMLRGKGSASK